MSRLLVRRRTTEAVGGLLFFVPALSLVLLLKGVPLIRGFVLSLTAKGEFAGLANYERMLRDDLWWLSLANAGKGFLLLPAFVLIPLLLAFALFEKVPGWKFFRASFFVSHVLPAAMTGIMFSILLSGTGPIVSFFKRIGLDTLAVPVLGRTETSLWAVYGVVFWAWFGLGVLVYLGGLAAVPEDLFDAAKVDGAGFVTILWSVTIPSVLPTMAYWAVVCTAGLLLWLFPFVYSMTRGGPGYSSILPEYYLYQVFSELVDPGYASTLGIALFLFVAVVSLFQIRILYGRDTA